MYPIYGWCSVNIFHTISPRPAFLIVLHKSCIGHYWFNQLVKLPQSAEIVVSWNVFFCQCFAFKPLMCLIYQLTEHYRTPPVFISMLCFLLWSWITFCTRTRTAIRAIAKVDRIAGHEDSYNIHKQNYITPPHGLHHWPTACMCVKIFKACQISGGINQSGSSAGIFTRAHIHCSKHEEEEGSWLGHGLDRWSRSPCTSLCLIGHFFLEKVPAFFQWWCIYRSDEAWQNTFGCRCCLLHFGTSERLPEKLRDSDHKGIFSETVIKFTPLLTRWRHFDLKLCLDKHFLVVWVETSALLSPMMHLINESGHLTLHYLCSVSFLCYTIISYLLCYTMWVNGGIFRHCSGHLGKFSTIFPNNLAVYIIL